MPSKFELITKVYYDACKEVVRSPQAWQRFLESACRNYRLRFDEQLLVFAQRPDATAVLEFEKWNRRFGRHINRGAKGIAVFENAEKTRIKHYFDISDTSETEHARPVPIWKYKDEYEQAVIETLENTFGELEHKNDMIDAVISAADNATEDNTLDYIADLIRFKYNSFLEELDEDSVSTIYRTLIKNSVAYMILSRLGISADQYFGREEFAGAVNFNTPETLNAVGFAASDIAEIALNEVSKTVLSLEKTDRIIAKPEQVGYTETEIKNERSVSNDRTHIQNRERSADTESDPAHAEEFDIEQIWADEKTVSQGGTPPNLLQSADNGQARQSSDGDGRESERNGAIADETDGGTGGLDGGTQSSGSDGLGAGNEQSEKSSTGDRAQRSDLRPVTDELPPFLDDDLIMGMLANPKDDLVHRKSFIVERFHELSESERKPYTQTIYGGRFEEYNINNTTVGLKSEKNGLLMYKGTYKSRTEESVFSWDIVAELVGQLIDEGNYLPKEKKAAPAQISLFDTADIPEEQNFTETEQVSFFTDLGVSQQIIDEALCIGANDKNSTLDIAMFFRRDRGTAYNAAFLKRHYGTNGTGFLFQGEHISVWYDESGIKVSRGDYANRSGATLVTWERAAKRIRELLDMGRYMPQESLDRIDDRELSVISDRLVTFIRDVRGDDAKEYLPTIRAITENVKGGYPEEVKAVKELLTDAERFDAIFREYDDFQNAVLDGTVSVYRYSYEYSVPYVFEILKGMRLAPLDFKAAVDFAPHRERFITEDEIKRFIRGHEKASEFRLATYSFFLSHSDEKERVQYFKDHYGWQGSYNGNDNIQYDAKGLLFSHGNLSEPYAKAEIPWKRYVKYVGDMIAGREFLSQEDLESLDYYERKQFAKPVMHFCIGVPYGYQKPDFYNYSDYWNSVEKIAGLLESPEDAEDIQKAMLDTSNAVTFEERYRDYEKNGLKTIEEYVNGIFTCFGDKSKTIEPLVELDETFNVPENDEEETIYAVLGELHIDDIRLETNGEHFTARDNENVWNDKAFYEFLINEAFVYTENGVLGIDDELLNRFLHYAEQRGVSPAEKGTESPEWLTDYREIKAEDPQTLVFYQVGDFYECYFDDAKTVADELDLVLTGRNAGGERISMCGFPKHSLDEYMGRLFEKGYRIAVSSSENGERITTWYAPEYPEEVRKALDLIDEYLEEEFGEDSKPVHSDLTNIDLAYTTTEDDKHEIQASVDLVHFRITQKVDGKITQQRTYDTLNGLTESELKNLYFDALVYVDEDTLSELENEENLAQTADLQPAFETAPKTNPYTFDLHPEIPLDERHDFDFANHEIQDVNKKERFHRNYAAIKVLKDCQSENRFATPEEQMILSRYYGWGGIPEAFDERADTWRTEYAMLKNILTPDEYASARKSTLTAFYTPQPVISAIYKVMENLGFKQGNILEPCCAIGNFIGMLPESMKDSKVYGIEIDNISAGIAQQLYQSSSVMNAPFEKAELPDSFFDAVVGNVPFGDYSLADKRYDKYHFLIHDYFFAKSLDKLRPGGVICLVTSKGTMDKESTEVRRYIAQRAELLGAIRLPDNTFKGNAGTEVTSDILILQKRDRVVEIEPDWIFLDEDENGIRMNKYFVDHPDMVLGEMVMQSGRFKPESACKAYEDRTLEEQLEVAVQNIEGEIKEYTLEDAQESEETYIPADPNVRNFSYTVVDGQIYFRENSVMREVQTSETAKNRIKGMIEIRDCVKNLLEMQTEDYSDAAIENEQRRLNEIYDTFVKKYGYINSRGNASAFSDDSSYFLICSLEIFKDGEFERKADMFTNRTIQPHIAKTHADTSIEAYGISIGEKAKVDMPFMCELTGKSEEEIYSDLKGVIFLNPAYGENSGSVSKYLPADEYLSGNVRLKLREVKRLAENDERFMVNAQALEKVQPVDLKANEIEVHLGVTWLPLEIIDRFMYETFQTPYYTRSSIKVHYNELANVWNITNKSADNINLTVTQKYGTSRKNAFHILEATLNLRNVRVFDYEEDENGKRVAILNKKETAIAQAKQELIKQTFKEWIWKDPERREKLCKVYNEKFNSIRPREYDGSHIVFEGMNPEITLRTHQKNAVARGIYGGNTLLAHCVGAGKTYTMAAIAQESKRLGLCSKSLFVVPNHLVSQWASEYLTLYPSAKILAATKKDFETKNRKKFCARIATGDYDAVIIGHSQFEKIPVSIGRQMFTLQKQIDELVEGIAELKQSKGERFTVKQLEATKIRLENKLQRLNDQSGKDDVVTFEELGVDRLFVDEAHYYKNLFVYSKMKNVGGISQIEAHKSSDMFMKCQYLDELTESKGITFATGTPISNSMVELYTMQRYLQYDLLKEYGYVNFDSWAAQYGETVTAVELTPEGTGYRTKVRFARFNNLPELMAMFKECADIQTSDMLKLPVPKANYHNISVKPSEMQKEMVANLGERAEKIRTGAVKPYEDNMLNITNDGRKLALDQRLINPSLPDFEGSKVNECISYVYQIWENSTAKKSTQLVFCDLSTPTAKGTAQVENSEEQTDVFTNVYDDIRRKLIKKGVPAEEIAFVHSAKNDKQKAELFAKVRSGKVRILLGSTQKMGAGTNVQDKLLASHDIDCPWRPSDLEQRAGRTIRPGNTNPEVHIYRYVTENTFDAYLYQLVEIKQKFVGQVMTSKTPVRSIEDVDEAALSYAEIKMLATGNPHIKEKMDLDIQVQNLRMLQSNYYAERYALVDKVTMEFPRDIARYNAQIKALEKDIQTASEHPKTIDDCFAGMVIGGVEYADKKKAGNAILQMMKSIKSKTETYPVGSYRGFNMEMYIALGLGVTYVLAVKGAMTHKVELGTDAFGNLTRIDNCIDHFEADLQKAKTDLSETEKQLEIAKESLKEPFSREQELQEKQARLNELNALLNVDKKDNEIIDEELEEDGATAVKREKVYVR